MNGRIMKPAVAALLIVGLFIPAPARARTAAQATGQPQGTPPAGSGTADALARVRAERATAERALSTPATPQDAAKAADQIRQLTAVEIAVATNGQSPQEAQNTINRINQEATTRLNEIERTSRDFLRNRLGSATSDEDKAAVWRTFDATILQLRITQEVAGEAMRRLNPVTPGMDNGAHREAYNSTQFRMERLLEAIANNHVEEPRVPSWSNPDGSRPSDLDREIEEHRRRQQRDADVQEYLRLAEAGVFVNPQTGEAFSQELRDRIAKNAKLQLAQVLTARGLDAGAVRTLFGWTDSRDALGHQIEDEVRNNSWYRALDMLNPSVSGADPQMIARAMANVLNLSANQIEAWRVGQLPEGGNGGVSGWLYENFWAKQKVGVGTALRVDDLEKGGAIDQQIARYREEVDAAVAALNEMAQTPDPANLTSASHRLLEGLGFITTVDGKQSYRIPTSDVAQRVQRGLNLPGSTLLDLVSSGNVIKIVLMVAAPELAAARIGAALEGLELGVGAIRAGEFITNVLANAALDAGYQKWERGTVEWDRVVLDAVVLNVGLGAVNQVTGAVARATVGGLMTAEARALAEVIARNRQARETTESILRQTLGLYSDAALLTYWQSKFQPSGMSYDDFLANMVNGVVGRLAPTAARYAKDQAASGIGLFAPKTIRDAIFGWSPELREAFTRGLSPDQLVRYIETARLAEQETARKEASDRLSAALGDDYLKLELNDARLVDKVTLALESGRLTFFDLKAVLGETPQLTAIMDGVNAHRIRTFDQIVETARTLARAEILAEYEARVRRFKENLGEGTEMYREAERVNNAWRDAELAKLTDKIDVPGSTNRTSDVDRSITSTYLRNALKVAIDEVFMRRTGLDAVSTSARAYDVNEYFHIFKTIDRLNELKALGLDINAATHTLPDGTTVSHPDMMTAMGLSVAMLDMPAAQRTQFKQSRLAAAGDTARMERLFDIAEANLARAQRELDGEVARLVKEGYDASSPDTIIRARDNLYGQRALDMAQMEATLARLDPKSPYARQLAAEIEAAWTAVMREGLEAYTNLPGLEIVVRKVQMAGLTARELIEGRVDTTALANANRGRREKNQPERTPAEQQQLIDLALADIAKTYTPEQLAGAIDDQIRFITHHINAFFEGHESATQAASALSKYAERAVLLMKLSGADVTTGLAAELNAVAGDLVKARSNLTNLTQVIAELGGGNANQGIRRLADLISQVVPGMRGLFTPEILTGLTAAAPTGAPTAAAAGSAALNALRREAELEREVIQRTAGSAMVVLVVEENKQALEQELAQLQRQKAEDDRLATLYNRSDWMLARNLEAQVAATALQLNALPFTNTPTAVQNALRGQLNAAAAQLQQLQKARTPAGVAPTEDDRLRERRIASLQIQIKEEETAIAHYHGEAEREAADARNRVASGNATFDPVRAAQREFVDTTRPSSTPELDKAAAELAKIWTEPPPAYAPPDFPNPPPPPTPAGGENPIVTGGLRSGGATVTITPNGSLLITANGVTYPGMFGTDGGFVIWAPGTVVNLNAPPPNPIATTPPSTIPTDGMTVNPDGSVVYTGVPISGLPTADGSATTSPLPGAVKFTPVESPTSTLNQPTPAGGAGGGGGNSDIGTTGSTGSAMNFLGSQPGMGWDESSTFEPFPEGPFTGGGTATNDGDTAYGGGDAIDLGGGSVTGDPGGCCTPGVQVMTLDFGEPATVPGSTTQPREEARRRLSLPRMARGIASALKFAARGAPSPAASAALSFANHSIGLPPTLNANLARARASAAMQAAPPMTAILQANGNSQGEAFEMTIVNNGSNPLKLLGTGVVVEPIKRELQNQLRQQLAKIVPGPNVLKRQVEAYCLQYALAPPTPGMLFQIAGPALQKQFKPAGMIMTAARQLAGAGALNPDSNPKSYLDSIKQYAIWTKFENWDVKKFGDVLLDKTKQAAAAAKANWTGQMQSALLAAVPNRWRDIQTVLSAAQELPSRQR